MNLDLDLDLSLNLQNTQEKVYDTVMTLDIRFDPIEKEKKAKGNALYEEVWGIVK